jgi:hypothetical protein
MENRGAQTAFILFTDIDIRLVVNSDIQLKNARLSRPNGMDRAHGSHSRRSYSDNTASSERSRNTVLGGKYAWQLRMVPADDGAVQIVWAVLHNGCRKTSTFQ